jgi:hypothetical protein
MVGNGANMYAIFHHSPRLQGSMGVLVFLVMTAINVLREIVVGVSAY